MALVTAHATISEGVTDYGEPFKMLFFKDEVTGEFIRWPVPPAVANLFNIPHYGEATVSVMTKGPLKRRAS